MSAEQITAWLEKHRQEIEHHLYYFAVTIWLVIMLMAEWKLEKIIWGAVATPKAIKTSGMHMR